MGPREGINLHLIFFIAFWLFVALALFLVIYLLYMKVKNIECRYKIKILVIYSALFCIILAMSCYDMLGLIKHAIDISPAPLLLP